VQYCKNCLLPDTKPGLKFDKDGICEACIAAREKNSINWESRKNELKKLLLKYKNSSTSDYDCIIPVSGGKDSHFQTHIIINEFNLNPLLVSFHPRDLTEIGRENLENIKTLGADCIEFSLNPQIYKKLAKIGFTEFGDAAYPEHVGIFTVPVQIAVNYNIPLLVWGENPQLEYGGPATARENPYLDKKWNEKFGGYFRELSDPVEMEKYDIDLKHLKYAQYPSDEKIKNVGVTGIFLGYFLKWDARKQVEIVKSLGFKTLEEPNEGTYTNYENLDTKYVGIHDYFKFIKFGYGRATDHASIDIRNNILSRSDGLKLVKKHEGKIPEKYLPDFLNDFKMTKNQFIEICDKFTNKSLFKTDNQNNLIRDDSGNIQKIKFDN